MNIAYNQLQRIGLTKFVDDSYIHEEYNRVFNFDELNKFLFGRKDISELSKLDIINDGIIFYNDNKKLYIKLNRLGDYIIYISKNLNFDGNYVLLNYYNLIGKKTFSGKQKKIYNIISSIKNKLFELKKSNDISLQTKKILEIISNYIGIEYFKGYIVSSIDENINEITIIRFDTLNKPFYITLNNGSLITNKTTINLNDNFDNLSCSLFVKNLIDVIIKNDKYTYMFEKLYKINGNESFTKIFLDSWNDKENFIVPTNVLNCLIMFKSIHSLLNYEIFFKNKYKNENIYKFENNKLYLKFEGINKYLLNIESGDLVNKNSKDSIIDFFHKSMIELMVCLEELYSHNCLY